MKQIQETIQDILNNKDDIEKTEHLKNELIDQLVLLSEGGRETAYDLIKQNKIWAITSLRSIIKERISQKKKADKIVSNKQFNINSLTDKVIKEQEKEAEIHRQSQFVESSYDEMENPVIYTTNAQAEPIQPRDVFNIVLEKVIYLNKEEQHLYINGGLSYINSEELIEAMTVKEAMVYLADKFIWKEYNKKIESVNLDKVPQHIVEAFIVKARNSKEIPTLRQVINYPIITKDGQIFDKKGYIEEAEVFITENININTDLPIEKAVKILTKPFEHFPFADEKYRANAFAFLFTCLFRNNIEGCVPLFHFSAPTQGSGKGLLLESFYQILYDNVRVPRSHWPVAATNKFKVDEATLSKKIGTALLNGHAVYMFDNIKDGKMVDSDILASVVTSPWFDVRVLYETREKTMPVRTVFAFTGNNLTVSKDLSRRVQTIRLEPDTEHPELRDLPDIKAYIHKNRNIILSAVFSILKQWFKAGAPTKNVSLGSFENWAKTVGGILDFAGIQGFDPKPDNLEDNLEVLRDKQFIEQIWGSYETDLFRLNEETIIRIAKEVYPDINTGDYSKILGHILKKNVDRVFELRDGFMVKLHKRKGYPVKYWLSLISEENGQLPTNVDQSYEDMERYSIQNEDSIKL